MSWARTVAGKIFISYRREESAPGPGGTLVSLITCGKV